MLFPNTLQQANFKSFEPICSPAFSAFLPAIGQPANAVGVCCPTMGRAPVHAACGRADHECASQQVALIPQRKTHSPISLKLIWQGVEMLLGEHTSDPEAYVV